MYVPVAQPDRVFGYEPKGRGFESLRARQLKTPETSSSGVFPCFWPFGAVKTVPNRADFVLYTALDDVKDDAKCNPWHKNDSRIIKSTKLAHTSSDR